MDAGKVELKAAVVVNQAEEAETCQRLRDRGVTLYEDWRGLFADWSGKLDVCLMPLPIHLHERAALEAMEAGANVLMEKPLTATLAQADNLRAAERRTGRWIAVGYQDFYRPSTIRLREDLAAGRIGKLREITWTGLWPRPEAYYRRNNWAGHLEVGGVPVRDSPLNNALAHYLNLSFLWSGADPSKVATARGLEAELYRCNSIESFDTAVVKITTDTGVRITASVTHSCEHEEPLEMHIHGEEGTLIWTHQRGARWSDGETLALEEIRLAFGEMMETVLSRVHNPAARICTTEHARSQVQTVEMLHERFPIRSVSPRLWEDKHSGMHGMIRVLDGVEADLHRCVAERSFPSELGLAWAKSAFEQTKKADLVTAAS